MHILVCDINVKKEGHYAGWYQYMFDNFQRIENGNSFLQLSFLFNKEAKEVINFGDHICRVNFLDVSFLDLKGFYNKYNILKRVYLFTIRNRVNQLIFMQFDEFQFSFFMKRFNCKVSGILFRPHHRVVPSNRHIKRIFSSKFVRFRKRIAEKLMMSNSAIQQIFILNDIEGVHYLNERYNVSHFKYLPDPIFNYNSQARVENDPDTASYKFLIFGALDERKNITNILKAYKNVTFGYYTEMFLIGPSKANYLEYLVSLISELDLDTDDSKKVIIKAEFVTNEEMDYYFSLCDVSLLIYKDFFGSSGLLGRAALHKKKVIGSNVGVINQLLDRYQIGLRCDPYSIESISHSFKKIKDYKLNSDACDAFYELHSPEVFVSTLLKI